jgi:hypothetical protein
MHALILGVALFLFFAFGLWVGYQLPRKEPKQ